MIKLNKLINLAQKITCGQHGQPGQHRKPAKIFWPERKQSKSKAVVLWSLRPLVPSSLHRRGPRRRCTTTLTHVVTPAFCIFRGLGKFGSSLRTACLKHLFKERSAPATASSRAITLGKLGRALRPFQPNEVRHLPLGHMETETKFIIGFHASALSRWPNGAPRVGHDGTRPGRATRSSYECYSARNPKSPWECRGQ